MRNKEYKIVRTSHYSIKELQDKLNEEAKNNYIFHKSSMINEQNLKIIAVLLRKNLNKAIMEYRVLGVEGESEAEDQINELSTYGWKLCGDFHMTLGFNFKKPEKKFIKFILILERIKEKNKNSIFDSMISLF
ncbi:MAG: hypothetical protein ABH800_01860 [Candidatus Nealsonbacteria bacterium]